ncbi:hypothetical protein EDD11_003841 [Mortierella claussenii]|nr:hypothetical protein EDD11_003841 [Mortierella claussenii]
MEKFSPGFPPANADHSPVEKVLTAVLMVIKPLTGIAKMILVGVVALGLVLFQTIGMILSPLVPLHRGYQRIVSTIFIRTILGLLGFFWIKHEIVTLKRGYDPVFTQIYPQTLTVREVSFWEALCLSGTYPELSPAEGVETLPLLDFVKAVHKKGVGPVVIFPEVSIFGFSIVVLQELIETRRDLVPSNSSSPQGTTTNNRAILKFVPIFKNCSVPETSIDISILALKYDYHKFAPTFTVGLNNSYRLGHLFRTCAQLYNTLSVRSLAPEESPSNANFSALDGLSSTPSGAALGVIDPVEEDPLGGVVMNLMGRITRFRKLGLNVQDKADFLDYFILRNNGINATKKSTAQKMNVSAAAGSGRLKRQ